MGRFYRTSTPVLEDYSSQIPELLFDSAQKIDAAIDKSYDQLDLLNTSLQSFKDFRPEDKPYVQEIIKDYNDKILQITENISNAGPENWKKHQQEIKNLQRQILEDTTTGSLSEIKKEKEKYDKFLAGIKKYLEDNKNHIYAQALANAEIQKESKGYVDFKNPNKYTPKSLSFFDINKFATDVAKSIPASSYTESSIYTDKYGTTYNRGYTSGGVGKNKIKTSVLESIKSHPEALKMYTDLKEVGIEVPLDEILNAVASTYNQSTSSKTNPLIVKVDKDGNILDWNKSGINAAKAEENIEQEMVERLEYVINSEGKIERANKVKVNKKGELEYVSVKDEKLPRITKKSLQSLLTPIKDKLTGEVIDYVRDEHYQNFMDFVDLAGKDAKSYLKAGLFEDYLKNSAIHIAELSGNLEIVK